MKASLFALSTLVFVGCATSELAEGKFVSLDQTRVTSACRPLGEVYGKGGGAMGGGLSDEELMQYATNDMRNKAAAMGATHIVTHSTTVGGGLVAATTGTASGTAYRCPASVAAR